MNEIIKKRIINIDKNPIKSFKEKYGLNVIFFIFLLIPSGLFDPVKCKKNKWTRVRNKIKNGRIKCKQKNRVNVGLLTENPPQIHCTK